MARSVALDRTIKAIPWRGRREQVQRAFLAKLRDELDRANRDSVPAFVRQFVDGK